MAQFLILSPSGWRHLGHSRSWVGGWVFFCTLLSSFSISSTCQVGHLVHFAISHILTSWTKFSKFVLFADCRTLQSTKPDETKGSPLSIFFGAMRLFFEILFCLQRVPLSIFLIFCNWRDVEKAQSPPFYIFRHYQTVQNDHFSFFFDNFLMSPKGSPFNFLIFCNELDFQKAQRVPPFTIFDIVRFFEMIIFCHIFFSFQKLCVFEP